MTEEPRKPQLPALINAYRGAAVIILNTVLLLVLVNVCAAAIVAVRGAVGPAGPPYFNNDGSPTDNGRRTREALAWFDYHAYEGTLSEDKAALLLDEFYEMSRRGIAYQPYTQFSESPYRGQLVNVDTGERGVHYRRSWNPPAQPGAEDFVVFVFGGSTTFGWLVPDEETWPSHLSKVLNERLPKGRRVLVWNLGRGGFTPSQEVLLYWDLLKLGHRPSLAIFMDGVNLGGEHDYPQFTPALAHLLKEAQTGKGPSLVAALLSNTAIGELLLGRRSTEVGVNRLANESAKDPNLEATGQQYLTNRFAFNWRLAQDISRRYSVPALFVLQPNALVGYRVQNFRRELPSDYGPLQKRYEYVYQNLAPQVPFVRFDSIFASWGVERKAFVDNCHYSPRFNAHLARNVAQRIDLRSLRPYSRKKPATTAAHLSKQTIVERLTPGTATQ